MKMSEDRFKVVLVDVQKQIDLPTIELIFENNKYVGKCDDEYMIENMNELVGPNETVRDIVIKYSSEKCAQNVLKNGKIIYDKKNWEFRLMPFESSKLTFNQNGKKEDNNQINQVVQNGEKMDTQVADNHTTSVDTLDKIRIDSNNRHELDAYKYPFYLLAKNEIVLKRLRETLTREFNSPVRIELSVDKRTLSFSGDGIGNDTRLLHAIDEFVRHTFARFDMTGDELSDDELWTYMRGELVKYFVSLTENDDDEAAAAAVNVGMTYNDEKKRRFLRIEGDFDQVERAKHVIGEKMAEFNRRKLNFMN